jgi:hypothetical protein
MKDAAAVCYGLVVMSTIVIIVAFIAGRADCVIAISMVSSTFFGIATLLNRWGGRS